MKTKKLIITLTGVLLSTGLFFVSCSKKSNSSSSSSSSSSADTDTQSAQDNALAEQNSNDAFSMSSSATEYGTEAYRLGNNGILSSCGTISPTTAGASSYTITFSGGTCNDGKTRSGVLLLTVNPSAPYFRNPGFTCTITTTTANPYIVNNYTVSINKTVTNTTPSGFNPATTNMTWSVSATVSVVKPNGGGTISWSCNRTHTLLNTGNPATVGSSTVAPCYTNQSTPINWPNAVVSISGTSSGTSAQGTTYSATATNVIRNHSCTPDISKPARHPFVQGTIAFTPAGKATRTIDYGNGTCDDLYTVTINGTTYGPFTLP